MHNRPPATNVLILDDQHQVLFDLLHDLKKMMTAGQGAAAAPTLLRKLAEYAQFHFPTEERLMLQYEYPLRDTHALQHRTFLADLHQLNLLVRQDDKTVSLQILDTLGDWLQHHIRDWDAKLGSYLNSRGVS